ncbi:MAG: hypothetical protein Fur005_37820 [Roseiflexaceae bacterium]
MEEIVKVVAEKTGMPADQVRPVVQIVINELKQRLPEPIAGQVDGLLNNPAASAIADQAGSLLGGLFGKKD